MSDLTKLDAGLAAALDTFERDRQQDSVDAAAGISVALRFEGDLSAIEALGFQTYMVSGTEALGLVRFKDIPALTAHPTVLRISAGRRPKPRLDTAVRDIKARATLPIGSTPPIDGVWHAAVASGAFTSVPDASGNGVIVAIIDTGIDYKHPMFLSQITPTVKTRILRIWDQGLVPSAVADCPAVALLASGDTYGVEFDSAKIENDLNAIATIAHKDCDGHGTHCAGIAAGGTLFPSGGDATFVGVAPQADIIAVKYLDTPKKIFYRLAAGPGGEVSDTLKFRDAVLYCLRTARALGKPVVISMSFGDVSEAGDGLDDEAVFCDGLMDPGKPAGPLNFPKGAIMVKACGNDGDPVDRLSARVVVPASGQITVPFLLTDARGGEQKRWDECVKRLYKPEIGVHFWYRFAAGVKFAMAAPPNGAFSLDVLIGGTFTRGFVATGGSSPSVTYKPPAPTLHRITLKHEDNGAVTHPSGTSIRRRHCYFNVEPKESGGTVSYHTGIYEVRVTAPPDTELFVLCEQEFWGPGLFVGFGIATTMMDTSILHGGITVTNDFSAVDTLGQHVITVAAYDETHSNHIAPFSSRGPLRNFSDPAAPLSIFNKPDIAGPGVDIKSADGIDTEVLVARTPVFLSGRRFVEHSGTSMAAPAVAGVIALMLDKKPDLNISQVRALLSTNARPPVIPPVAKAYGSGMVDTLKTHDAT